MRKIPYTYSLVKYMHNPSVGEVLNIGVLLVAPMTGFVGIRFNQHYERLSKTFADFDGEHYREIVGDIERRVRKLGSPSDEPQLFSWRDMPESVEDVILFAAPDRGLSIQFGPTLAGLTDEPKNELMHIFERSVIAQYPLRDSRGRDDEDVWHYYHKRLREKRIDKHLEPRVFSSESYEFKFEHTFKNERWHILKPVTMDYAQTQTIQDRATRVLGEASALEGNREIGTYYILLGEPHLESHKAAYTKAKNLLHKIPIKKEIIEEDAAEDFAGYLADYMDRHGLIG